MLKRERHDYILHQVNLHNRVLSTMLSTEINVSEDTIRRDLVELAMLGRLKKIHGGAVSTSFNGEGAEHSVYALEAKRKIAKKAAALIKDGMFVLTSGGTTIIELAKQLPVGLKATFITGSIPVLSEYMKHPNIEIIVLGDRLNKSSAITLGAEVSRKLKSIQADMCILGVNAIDPQFGITENEWEIVQLKQEMLAASKQAVCLSISEKINTVQPLKICDISGVNVLVTELQPEDERLSVFQSNEIKLL